MGGIATGLRSYPALGVGACHILRRAELLLSGVANHLHEQPGNRAASSAGLDAATLPLTSLPSSNFHVGPAKWLPAGLPVEVVSFASGP